MAVIVWAAASVAFGFYLAHYASCNRVYGTLGAAVAFLVWLRILNVAALIGVEINRAIEIRAASRARTASGVAETSGASPSITAAATDVPTAGRQATSQDSEDDYNRV